MQPRQLLCVSESDQRSLWEAVRSGGWNVHRASNLKTAKKKLLEHRFLTGLFFFSRYDDGFCWEVAEFLGMHERIEWIGIFPDGAMSSAACRELVVSHLFDFHTLPVEPVRLLNEVGHAYGRAQLLQSPPAAKEINPASALGGESSAMRRLMHQIRKVASTDEPVLIRGESGSGKELAVQAVRQGSARAGKPFVAVHCGGLPATLIQSQLFGYEKGSFTGAHKTTPGLIESSAGGTIFLDEIGDLSIDVQTSLLRFLQEKTITRLGSSENIHVDTRVIATTHVDLEERIAKGLFREDLYYRLSVLPLWIPPLRERKEDLDQLAQHFFIQFGPDKRPRLKGFNSKALQAMHEHSWPGNIRELSNRIHRAMVMAEGRLITAGDLGLEHGVAASQSMSLDLARSTAEKNAIHVSLQHAGKNIACAARSLGVSRMTLYRLMEKHGMHGAETRSQ